MPALSLDPRKPGPDRSNALYLARACALAYKSPEDAVPLFRSDLGLEARLISVDNSQAYVGHDAAAVVVAFRGSQAPTTLDGLKDWLLTNASNFLVLPEGQIGTDFAAAGVGARFHRGFLQALDELWTPLLRAVEDDAQDGNRQLWITGHSLGGALALLAAWRFQRHFLAVHQVYTFGAPMIGNEAAAKAFEREFPSRIFRYVDEPDPVPLLPTVSLIANAYNHCLQEIRLTHAQTPTSNANSLVGDLASRTINGLLNATLIDELWAHVQQRIGAHSITNYEARIQNGNPPESHA
jgi:hypothetical protein